jgi:hypothetical protein
MSTCREDLQAFLSSTGYQLEDRPSFIYVQSKWKRYCIVRLQPCKVIYIVTYQDYTAERYVGHNVYISISHVIAFLALISKRNATTFL